MLLKHHINNIVLDAIDVFFTNQIWRFYPLNSNPNILKESFNNLIHFPKETTKVFLCQAKREKSNLNDLKPTLLNWFSSEKYLGEVLYTLLSSAFKFTPKKRIIWYNSKQVSKTELFGNTKEFLEATLGSHHVLLTKTNFKIC